jgi:cyclophilin family peptidyl-prolyl cis-trans isomerase
VAWAATAGGVNGQEVRGRVVAEGTETGIPGAAVLLLGADGARVHAVLADGSGLFRLRAPSPGGYLVRAEMIGRRTVEVDVVVGDTTAFLSIALPVQPIELRGLAVDAASRCRARAEAVSETHIVWEEVQKALRAEVITREQALFQFLVARYERRLDRSAREVEAEEVEYVVQIRDDPFETLPPEVLAREGYVHDEDGATYIYGPNTGVLLSDGFQDTHCFALRRDDARAGQIGLVFEPAEGRRLPDIGGVLWVDEASAELRELEFRYHNMPRRLARGEYSGFAAFHRMPGGGWIIRRWHIRSPVPGNRNRVVGYSESAGVVEELTRIVTDPTLPRVRLETDEGAIVVVIDTARAPLTAGTFLRLVDAGGFDGLPFHRAARAGGGSDGAQHGAVLHLGRGTEVPATPIALEGTSTTGIPHIDGTISMAHGGTGPADGRFFIVLGEQPARDASFAAFGRVIEGMEIVRRIHARAAEADSAPVAVVRARRGG